VGTHRKEYEMGGFNYTITAVTFESITAVTAWTLLQEHRLAYQACCNDSSNCCTTAQGKRSTALKHWQEASFFDNRARVSQ
jgi:hypothetical protein